MSIPRKGHFPSKDGSSPCCQEAQHHDKPLCAECKHKGIFLKSIWQVKLMGNCYHLCPWNFPLRITALSFLGFCPQTRIKWLLNEMGKGDGNSSVCCHQSGKVWLLCSARFPHIASLINHICQRRLSLSSMIQAYHLSEKKIVTIFLPQHVFSLSWNNEDQKVQHCHADLLQFRIWP